MKNIKTLLVLLSLFGLWSCEKDEIRAVLNPSAAPAVQLSAPTVVLSKDEASKDILTVSWQKPDYGFDAGASYSLLIDKKGNNFAKPAVISTGTALSKTFKNDELNKLLTDLGLEPGQAGQLDVKVQAKLSDAVSLTSPLASLTATTYLDRLDLSTPWGVVGDAINNWGATPDGPFYKTSNPSVLVAYVTLTDGFIKFRKDQKWDVNYGDDGNNGTLEADGKDIPVKAGTYRITFDTSALTYKIEKYYWGVVGDAINNWGATPDGRLMYDPYSDQWRAILTLTNGSIKIRQNEDWGVNFGDNGANGTLEANGDNIAVTAGTYLVTVNFNDNTYTLKKVTNLWGLVGDATPNGWGGPDVPFALDYANYTDDFNTKGIWIIKDVTLTKGEMKFRANNDWGLNYGDDGGDGTLEANGANIPVVAGKYDITLDFGTLKYSVKKK